MKRQSNIILMMLCPDTHHIKNKNKGSETPHKPLNDETDETEREREIERVCLDFSAQAVLWTAQLP